jgi:hypothetical protein
MALDLEQSNSSKSDFGRVADGSYPARVAQIIDIGRQQETAWVGGKAVPQYYIVGDDGKAVKNDEGYAKKSGKESSMPCIQPKVFVTFELPTETIEIEGEDRPRWQSKEYNITNSGALIKMVKALNPEASKISDIAGSPCMISIGSTESGNAKIASVSPMMKGLEVAELANDPVVFDMDNPDLEVFNKLPEFLRNKIKAAKNFEGSAIEKLLENSTAATPEPAGDKAEDFDSDSAPF